MDQVHTEVGTRPTVIVRHRRENRKKCSLEPLVGRPGFLFHSYPLLSRPDLKGYVRLALDGPLLSERDSDRGILLLDATWRRVKPMVKLFEDVEPRSLPRLETAYPRRSKVMEDPEQGLASIEALYLAYRILGRPCEDLLAQFRDRDRFLGKNTDLLRALGPAR